MRRILTPLALSLALTTGAQAADLEISLGNDDGEIQFSVPTENYGMENGQAAFGVLFNEDDDWLGHLSLQSIGRVSESLSFHVGVKGYVADLDRADETVTAIGIGGGVRLGLASTVPVSLVFSGFLAPSILSFSDAEEVMDLEARVEAEFARNAAAFVGYNYVEVDLEDGRDVEIQDGLNVGVRLRF